MKIYYTQIPRDWKGLFIGYIINNQSQIPPTAYKKTGKECTGLFIGSLINNHPQIITLPYGTVQELSIGSLIKNSSYINNQ